MSTKTLYIVAGEDSGDRRATEVVSSLKQLDPSLSFEGLGGEQLKAAGVNVTFDLASLAVIGFTDVIKKYGFFRKLFYQTLERIKELQPAAVILVDYPGFNLRLAKKIKKLNIPVIYYISPQVWAWAPWRVNTIAKIVDKMLVILPFEVAFYRNTGLDVEFVGHPLIGRCEASENLDQIKNDLGAAKANPVISLLAGSRKGEVKKILPVMLEAAELVLKQHPNTYFVISKASHLDEVLYKKILARVTIPHVLTERSMHDLVSAADFCWVTSGTATLETALFRKPFIILYKTSWLTYMMAKYLITIPYIGLVNVIAGHKVIPEFLQKNAHPKTIAHETHFILNNENAKKTLLAHLDEVKKKLGAPGAHERAAQAILTFLSER